MKTMKIFVAAILLCVAATVNAQSGIEFSNPKMGKCTHDGCFHNPIKKGVGKQENCHGFYIQGSGLMSKNEKFGGDFELGWRRKPLLGMHFRIGAQLGYRESCIENLNFGGLTTAVKGYWDITKHSWINIYPFVQGGYRWFNNKVDKFNVHSNSFEFGGGVGLSTRVARHVHVFGEAAMLWSSPVSEKDHTKVRETTFRVGLAYHF